MWRRFNINTGADLLAMLLLSEREVTCAYSFLQAVGQVEAELNGLIDNSVLLRGFNLAGLRICAVTLTSFSGDSNPPAPAPSSNGTATFATRSGSSEYFCLSFAPCRRQYFTAKHHDQV